MTERARKLKEKNGLKVNATPKRMHLRSPQTVRDSFTGGELLFTDKRPIQNDILMPKTIYEAPDVINDAKIEVALNQKPWKSGLRFKVGRADI